LRADIERQVVHLLTCPGEKAGGGTETARPLALAVLAAVLAAELVYPSRGVHDFLLAGVERVAGGTDLYVELFVQGGTGRKLVTATADHFDVIVLRMYSGSHDNPVINSVVLDLMLPKRENISADIQKIKR
jgi:hypothetical protein